MEGILPDIPRIYTALAEWMACLVFVLLLKKRCSKWATIGIVSAALLIQIQFLEQTEDAVIYLWLPVMMTAVFLMILFIFICCDIKWQDAAYFGMLAFITAEFAASLEWQIVFFCWPGETNEPDLAGALILFLIFIIVNLWLWRILKKHLPRDGKINSSRQEYVTALIMGSTIFIVSNLSFLSIRTPFSSRNALEIANTRTLVELGGIALLYAHMVQCSEVRVRRELEAVQNVLQNQYQQYRQSRESIELINYKYHDLKHQIAVLRSEQNQDRRNAFLDQMEEEIRAYELQNKTGNQILDTVLTSKSLYCAKHGITLTSVADGKLLEFMDVMDICSIFGNALDNAIECELKIPDKEKRLIHLTMTKQKKFLMIRFENYYEGELNKKEGRFITTKNEKQFHGYGIQSISYIVNKYEGAVNIDTSDNWFDLKILIPLPEKQLLKKYK